MADKDNNSIIIIIIIACLCGYKYRCFVHIIFICSCVLDAQPIHNMRKSERERWKQPENEAAINDRYFYFQFILLSERRLVESKHDFLFHSRFISSISFTNPSASLSIRLANISVRIISYQFILYRNFLRVVCTKFS